MVKQDESTPFDDEPDTEQMVTEEDEASGLEDALESEAVAPPKPQAVGGGLQTTDPAFAGGAMEIETQPYPPKAK